MEIYRISSLTTWYYVSFMLSLCASQPSAPFPTTPTHDMACLVPPAPVNNVTGKNQLFSLTVNSPWFPDPDVDRIRETLYFTHGDCGLDVFVLEKGWIFDDLIPVGFSNYCRKLNPMSQTDLPQVNMIAAGSLAGGIAPTLMPMPRRLPTHWRSGIIIWVHYDRVVAEGRPLKMICNYPYNNILGGRINVILNVNATLNINGCPLRKYGAKCDQSCNYCARDVNCNSFTGACLCPQGFYGSTCAIARQGIRLNHESLYLPYGETANLTCTSHGIKPRSGRWHKQGTPQQSVTGYENVNYKPRPMVIYTVIVAQDTSVDGIYTCEVVDEIGETYRRTVNITVIGIPDSFIEFPFDQEVTIGSRVSFRCSVKELTGRLRWYRGSHSFPRNSTELVSNKHLRIINHSPSTSELVIDEVEIDDDDVYKCFVGHVFTERDLVFAQARLTVFVPTRSRIVGFGEGHTLSHREQAPLYLECKADFTKPPPQVTWYVGDMVRVKGVITNTMLTEDGFTYNITSRLAMAPLWKHDTHEIRCVMENFALGTVSETAIILNITYLPRVKTPSQVDVFVGEELLIECLASANPAIREYRWTVEQPNESGTHSLTPSEMSDVTGEDEIPHANTDLAGEFGGNVYKLRKVDERHNDMIVKCTAFNMFGSGSSDTHIRVKTKPAEMSAPVIGIGIMVAVGLLVLVVILQCFKRQIRSLCADKTEEREEKDYDVFVCYKSGTEEEELYVVRILIPWLEERGFSVCVHYKNFNRNKGEDANITEAVTHSIKVILVLSPAFINSSWYMYDFRPSLDELNTVRQDDVIPIMYEDMTLARNVDPALYRLLRNVSYIQWPAHDPEGCGSQELFWKLLRNSLPRVPLGEKGSGMAASEVSLPDMVGTESMRYNAEEESLWPLPPRRERLFQSRRMSDNSRRTPRAREMVQPNTRRHRALARQEGWRNPANTRTQQRNNEVHDQNRGREEEGEVDMNDPNRVLII